MSLPQGNVLLYVFQWLWLVWILLICPAGLIFSIVALASSGRRSSRCKKLAISFAAVSAISTFVFIFFLVIL
ncbi:MAG: hypothetical protein ACK2T3_03975 [Candidatus Promineifilaceae bacterium]